MFDFPLLAYQDDRLFVDKDGAGFKIDGAFFPDADTMVCRVSARRGAIETPGWFLEITGRFREITPRGRRRTWALPFQFLIPLALCEYAMSAPRTISVGELKQKLVGVQDHFPEAPLAADLRRYLRKHRDDAPVTEAMLRAWPM
ncbi:hypothetical protein [Pseudomonas sp. CGJS7]|uniref:hypothetical protein n=1 Tax=Pseudomonas sp. CGJS7 TaxID=3109348 RepID=UPI003009BA61